MRNPLSDSVGSFTKEWFYLFIHTISRRLLPHSHSICIQFGVSTALIIHPILYRLMEIPVFNFAVTSHAENKVNDTQLNLCLQQSIDQQTIARLSRSRSSKRKVKKGGRKEYLQNKRGMIF